MDALYKDQDEIINTLFDIIKRFMIQPSILKQDMIHEPLLGAKFRLTARELVYLIYEVEKEFNIKVSQEDICNGKFCTIKGIANIIYCSSLKKRSEDIDNVVAELKGGGEWRKK